MGPLDLGENTLGLVSLMRGVNSPACYQEKDLTQPLDLSSAWIPNSCSISQATMSKGAEGRTEGAEAETAIKGKGLGTSNRRILEAVVMHTCKSQLLGS